MGPQKAVAASTVMPTALAAMAQPVPIRTAGSEPDLMAIRT